MGIARIQCYLGRHLRSRGRARRKDYGWHSYCRRCGVEMIKEDGGDWTVVDPSEIDRPEAEPVARGPLEAEIAIVSEAVALKSDAPPKRSRLARLFRRKR